MTGMRAKGTGCDIPDDLNANSLDDLNASIPTSVRT